MEKGTGIPVLAQIPIRPEIAGSVDEGTVEYVKAEFLEKAAEAVEKLLRIYRMRKDHNGWTV